jgi:hypothetical protein
MALGPGSGRSVLLAALMVGLMGCGSGTYPTGPQGAVSPSAVSAGATSSPTPVATPTSEPRYPGTARRADWGLPDGTLVEYAGLLADEDYRATIEEKRAIGTTLGVPLIVLVPEDLTDLSRALRLAT